MTLLQKSILLFRLLKSSGSYNGIFLKIFLDKEDSNLETKGPWYLTIMQGLFI